MNSESTYIWLYGEMCVCVYGGGLVYTIYFRFCYLENLEVMVPQYQT